MKLVAWELVCKPKEMGGLGVMDLAIFNQALLLKWHWYWAKPEGRIWKQIYQYTSSTEILAIGISLRETNLKQIFNVAVTFIPGNGVSIGFWEQNWGEGTLKHQFPNLYTYATDTDITLFPSKGRLGITVLSKTKPF